MSINKNKVAELYRQVEQDTQVEQPKELVGLLQSLNFIVETFSELTLPAPGASWWQWGTVATSVLRKCGEQPTVTMNLLTQYRDNSLLQVFKNPYAWDLLQLHHENFANFLRTNEDYIVDALHINSGIPKVNIKQHLLPFVLPLLAIGEGNPKTVRAISNLIMGFMDAQQGLSLDSLLANIFELTHDNPVLDTHFRDPVVVNHLLQFVLISYQTANDSAVVPSALVATLQPLRLQLETLGLTEQRIESLLPLFQELIVRSVSDTQLQAQIVELVKALTVTEPLDMVKLSQTSIAILQHNALAETVFAKDFTQLYTELLSHYLTTQQDEFYKTLGISQTHVNKHLIPLLAPLLTIADNPEKLQAINDWIMPLLVQPADLTADSLPQRLTQFFAFAKANSSIEQYLQDPQTLHHFFSLVSETYQLANTADFNSPLLTRVRSLREQLETLGVTEARLNGLLPLLQQLMAQSFRDENLQKQLVELFMQFTNPNDASVNLGKISHLGFAMLQQKHLANTVFKPQFAAIFAEIITDNLVKQPVIQDYFKNLGLNEEEITNIKPIIQAVFGYLQDEGANIDNALQKLLATVFEQPVAYRDLTEHFLQLFNNPQIQSMLTAENRRFIEKYLTATCLNHATIKGYLADPKVDSEQLIGLIEETVALALNQLTTQNKRVSLQKFINELLPAEINTKVQTSAPQAEQWSEKLEEIQPVNLDVALSLSDENETGMNPMSKIAELDNAQPETAIAIKEEQPAVAAIVENVVMNAGLLRKVVKQVSHTEEFFGALNEINELTKQDKKQGFAALLKLLGEKSQEDKASFIVYASEYLQTQSNRAFLIENFIKPMLEQYVPFKRLNQVLMHYLDDFLQLLTKSQNMQVVIDFCQDYAEDKLKFKHVAQDFVNVLSSKDFADQVNTLLRSLFKDKSAKVTALKDTIHQVFALLQRNPEAALNLAPAKQTDPLLVAAAGVKPAVEKDNLLQEVEEALKRHTKESEQEHDPQLAYYIE